MRWLGAGTLLVSSACAVAGSLSVSPVRIDLSPAMRSVVLNVRNDGDRPVVVQSELVAWSQEDNQDRLESTDDLIASPPIFKIAPGGVQIVRIALRRAPDPALETSYRVLLNEVPGSPQAGFGGAQFALQISLPIFVAMDARKVSPKVSWSAARNIGGDFDVTIRNAGNAHIRVHSIAIAAPGGEADATFSGLLYVLPGERRNLTIKSTGARSIASDRITVKAETDAGSLNADVVLAK